MHSWIDDVLLSVIRWFGQFFSGRPMLGSATSDATFWRRGGWTTRRRWPASAWSIWPGWRKLLVRVVVVAAIGSVVVWRWKAAAALAVALLVCAAVLLWRKPWLRDPVPVKSRFDPRPLFDNLRPILGISDRDFWHEWIGVPADIDSEDRSQPIYLRLPENWSQDDPRHSHVTRIVDHHVPGEWTPMWYLEGYVEFHPLPAQLPVLPLSGAAAQPTADHAGQYVHVDLPSYQPPELDSEFDPTQAVIIDGGQIERARRDYRD